MTRCQLQRSLLTPTGHLPSPSSLPCCQDDSLHPQKSYTSIISHYCKEFLNEGWIKLSLKAGLALKLFGKEAQRARKLCILLAPFSWRWTEHTDRNVELLTTSSFQNQQFCSTHLWISLRKDSCYIKFTSNSLRIRKEVWTGLYSAICSDPHGFIFILLWTQS